LYTTRRGGVSPAPYDDGHGAGGFNLGVHVGDAPALVAQNRALLRAALPGEPCWLSQVHGVAVADAALPHPTVLEADASIASVAGAVCLVQTADCLPVLFSDREGRVVGAAHAGWRGLAAGVLQETVAAMQAAGAGEILAWLGPAIGPNQFEVGAEVRAAFLADAGGDAAAVHAAFQPQAGREGKFLADIYALARIALHRVGVVRVSGGEFCTVSDAASFYSYRRDGVTGRQASLIWIK
jgi:YfiH family protein